MSTKHIFSIIIISVRHLRKNYPLFKTNLVLCYGDINRLLEKHNKGAKHCDSLYINKN